MSNTLVYAEDWAVKLQERLSEPTKWKDICNVEYTNERVLHNPYMSDATVQSGTRGTGYTPQAVTQTDDSITINQYQILPQVIDRADLAQSTYSTQMVLADRQGILLDEAIETAAWGAYASMTSFGDTSSGAGTSFGTATPVNITVSATNIDDIIRNIKEQINVAKGQKLAARNGVFIVWRPADMTILESFMQANGFLTADSALRSGGATSSEFSNTAGGIDYMGVTHYASNLLTAGHVIAGVKKVFHLGIVKDTYGQVVITQDPVVSSAQISGVGVISRIDYAFKVWHNVASILFNVLVN